VGAVLLVACSHALSAKPAAVARPAASVPGYFRGLSPHPRYFAAGYVTDFGESASGMEGAEADARARVAQQVRSQVSSQLDLLETETAGPGGAESSEARRREVRVTTDFSRADLIRIVERREADGRFHAYAALDKDEAGRVLGPEYDAAAAEFRAAAAEALASLTNARAFTSAYQRARRAAAVVRSRGAELAAVSPVRAADVRKDWALLAEVRGARVRVLQSHAVSALGAPEAQPVVAATAQALATHLGVPVAAGGRLGLKVQVEESFLRAVGVCCKWAVKLTLDGAPLPFDVAPVGCARDRNLAREAVAREFSPDKLAEPLRTAFAAVLPLEE
jgi:hypothetical protein